MKSDYDKYLKSKAWQKLKQQAIDRDKCCRLCSSTKYLHVHHRKYSRFGSESVDDLTTLCRKCHDMFHKYSKLITAPPKGQGTATKETIQKSGPIKVYTKEEIKVLGR